MTTENERLTASEIEQRFRDSDLDPEFKSLVLTRLDATLQAMYNAVYHGEEMMKYSDTHGDKWQEEHNHFVEVYQSCHN